MQRFSFLKVLPVLHYKMLLEDLKCFLNPEIRNHSDLNEEQFCLVQQ